MKVRISPKSNITKNINRIFSITVFSIIVWKNDNWAVSISQRKRRSNFLNEYHLSIGYSRLDMFTCLLLEFDIDRLYHSFHMSINGVWGNVVYWFLSAQPRPSHRGTILFTRIFLHKFFISIVPVPFSVLLRPRYLDI